VRIVRVEPGRPLDARRVERLTGAVLTRDLSVSGTRWSKGRRLSVADLAALGEPGAVAGRGVRAAAVGLDLLVPGPSDVHEDAVALRLAAAVAGPCLVQRGPHESRVDLLAEADGVAVVDVALLERLDRIDPLEVFTVLDGQTVRQGELVASVKCAPHLVPERIVARAERLTERARAAGRGPVVQVLPFLPRRVAALVKESVAGAARQRFETTVRRKVEALGSELMALRYVADEPAAVAAALRSLNEGEAAADLVLTAGGASTDPRDAFFVALRRLGGRIVRRGVPAHPGSMLWLGRLGPTIILGLPTCGAYSKATAADLLLPRLLAGEPPTAATVARLGYGGVLTPAMRFRMPAYARELEAPEG
jgi:Probable molybdopterin binding domain